MCRVWGPVRVRWLEGECVSSGDVCPPFTPTAFCPSTSSSVRNFSCPAIYGRANATARAQLATHSIISKSISRSNKRPTGDRFIRLFPYFFRCFAPVPNSSAAYNPESISFILPSVYFASYSHVVCRLPHKKSYCGNGACFNIKQNKRKKKTTAA